MTRGKKKSSTRPASRATARDLLARAVQAPTLRDRRRLREQAGQLLLADPRSAEASTWAELAAAHARDEEREDALRCLDRALALAGTQIWVYRKAAEVQAAQLGDREAASRVLGACGRAFEENPDGGAYLWKLLAAGYRETLGDEAAALDCLARGFARARTVGDFCSLAEGYLEAGNTPRAHELVAGALALAEREPEAFSWWTLANLHLNALGDAAGAQRLLARGREVARTTTETLTIASAYASHRGQETEIRACLDLAATRAVSAADWVEAAEGFHDHLADREATRRCLERAILLAAHDDAGTRQQIADGLRRWLGLAGQADRIAASGHRPSVIVGTAHRCLPDFQPDADSLFDLLRSLLDDAAIERIASCDYATSIEKHLAPLREIRDLGMLPHPLTWYPLEVLALTRWGEGEGTDHRERAFACAVLCLDAAGPRTTLEGTLESSLPSLVESCTLLGPAALDALIGLCAALVESFANQEMGREGELFARLALLLAVATREPHDPRLAPGVRDLIALEEAQAEEEGYSQPEVGWLFGLTYYDQRLALWRSLIKEQAARAPALGPLAALI